MIAITTRGRGAATCTAVLAGVLVALTACSSSPASSASGGGTATSAGSPGAPVDLSALSAVSLTVGLPNANLTHLDFYWPAETDVFARLNIKVNVQSQGATTSTNLAAGRLPLGSYGTTGMFPAVQAGRKLSVVAAQQTGNSSGGLAVKAGSPYQQVQDLSGKKLGVVGVNGAQYGAGELFSNYIVAQGGKPLKLQVESNQATLTAALESGQIDAAVGSEFGAAIEAGVLRQLLRATDPLALQITGQQVVTDSYYGLSALLDKNRDAVVRFIAGIRIGLQTIQNATTQQIAAALVMNPAFTPAQMSASTLADDIADNKPFVPANGGYVSADDWAKSLTSFKSYGLKIGGSSVDVGAQQFSYPSLVDMSYWNAATPIVTAYFAKYK